MSPQDELITPEEEEAMKAVVNILHEVREMFGDAMDRTNALIPKLPDENTAKLIREASMVYAELIQAWVKKIESSENAQELVNETVEFYEWISAKGGEYASLLEETERVYGIKS